ncbi:hypothetical protein JCM16816_04680 [Thermoanaerobacter brockii subsp. lactiethylicus]|jgi:radical SAM protein with 4Fe4S-binding SPASM domain
MDREEIKHIWNNLTLNKYLLLRINEHYIIRAFEPKSRYKILNYTGREILDKLEKKINFDQFINYMLENYEVKEKRLLYDIMNFLNILRDEKIIIFPDDIKNDVGESGKRTNGNIKNKNDLTNLVYDYYFARNQPYKVFLELTYNCNLKCKHCYLGNARFKLLQYTPLERIKELLTELKNSGVIEVFITGGEPFLHPNFFEILEYAVDMNFFVTILTNGTCINDENIQRLLKLKVNDIKISIYGFGKTHDKFVGVENSFNRSMTALGLLRENNLGKAVTVLNTENVNEIYLLKDFLEQLNIEHEVSPLIFPTLYGDPSPTNYRLNEQQLKQVIKNLNIKIGGNICTAGVSRFRITPDGDVNPCEMLRHISFGNINKVKFQDILISEKRERWIKVVKNKIINEKCGECNLKRFCINCMGLSYLETGKLDSVSQFACLLARVQNEIWGKNKKRRTKAYDENLS